MKKLIILIMFTMLFGCSSTRYQVMPEYRGIKPIKGKTLAVVYSPDSLIIQNIQSIPDDFGDGNTTERFSNFLELQLPGKIHAFSYFAKVIFPQPTNSDILEDTELKVAEETITVPLPPKGTGFEFEAVEADFVLQISSIRTFEEINTTFDISTNVPKKTRYLKYEFEHAIWDNIARRLVSYGRGQASNQVLFSMTRAAWASALTDLVKQMMKGTPFHKSSAY